MKFRYILGVALSELMFVSCASDNDPLGALDNIQIDQTFVTIPVSGGNATVTIKSTDSWSFDNVFEKGTLPVPKWLTASATSGAAGETTISFHADAVDGGREAALQISVGSKKQFLTVRQGSLVAAEATCAEVIAGADGKNYRVTGTCTGIYNTKYGNWYLNDGTGEITIYGTADKNGKLANEPINGTDGWKFEPGDVITVEGPKTTYGTTVELVDVTVIKVVKSMLKLPVSEASITPDAQEFEVKVAYKGSGAYAAIPENAKSWLTYLETKYVAGVKTIFEKNPADTAIVKFSVAANTGATRSAAIAFSSSSNTGSTTMPFNLTQKGMAKGDGTANNPFNVVALAEYAKNYDASKEIFVKAKVSEIKSQFSSQYGNADFFIFDDGTTAGQFQVYRALYLGNKKWVDGNKKLAVGDDVIICGKVGEYKGVPQIAQGGYLVSLNGDTGATYAYDFKAKGLGDWTLENVVALPDGLSFVWAYDSKYGMKASAYVGGTRYVTDNWLVSPSIKIENATTMSFKQALNYATSEYVKVMYTTTNGSGAVKADEWKEAEVDKWPAGNNWTFIESNATLPAGTVRVAFRYTSDTEKAATWEIESMSIQ